MFFFLSIHFLCGNPLCLFSRLLECPYGVARAPHSPRVHDVVLYHQVRADGADPKKSSTMLAFCSNFQDTFWNWFVASWRTFISKYLCTVLYVEKSYFFPASKKAFCFSLHFQKSQILICHLANVWKKNSSGTLTSSTHL